MLTGLKDEARARAVVDVKTHLSAVLSNTKKWDNKHNNHDSFLDPDSSWDILIYKKGEIFVLFVKSTIFCKIAIIKDNYKRKELVIVKDRTEIVILIDRKKLFIMKDSKEIMIIKDREEMIIIELRFC